MKQGYETCRLRLGPSPLYFSPCRNSFSGVCNVLLNNEYHIRFITLKKHCLYVRLIKVSMYPYKLWHYITCCETVVSYPGLPTYFFYDHGKQINSYVGRLENEASKILATAKELLTDAIIMLPIPYTSEECSRPHWDHQSDRTTACDNSTGEG